MKGQPADKEKAARTAVQGLLKADKAKALALAVLLATSAGCTVRPEGAPCAGQPEEAPCAMPSGVESGWLSQPVWPMTAQSAAGAQAQHLATDKDFVANPQYTQLRAGERPTNGPTYYGGGHYWTTYRSSGSYSGGSSGFSS